MTRPIPEWIQAARSKWHYRGQERPPWAQIPSPGQESVWDYPRPPRLMADPRRVLVCVQGKVLADSCSAIRIMETASPPAFYLPSKDVNVSRLTPMDRASVCEWKGTARYWQWEGAEKQDEPVAWAYPHPYPEYEPIAGYFSFYPGRIECYVQHELVRTQPGGLYGGWITKELVGPFKGPPGTEHW